jgi:hypothetical protein
MSPPEQKAHRRVLIARDHRVQQFIAHLKIESIVSFRAIEREHGQAVFDFKEDGWFRLAFGHGVSSET